MITEGSRYEDVPVRWVTDSDGVSRPTLLSRSVVVEPGSFRSYITSPGDRLDLLAFRFLGDPELWTALAQLNPHLGSFPAPLPAGVDIRVPAEL